MAADDASVTVVLRADLKGYEAALKAAVRATERAAKAAEDLLNNIGKGGKGADFSAMNQNFSKSAKQMQNDARIMQFQLNDIFSGLATGGGVRSIQMQMGQISQLFTGLGLRASAGLVGSAFMGMITPINLAIVGFTALTFLAPKFFKSAEDGAKEAAKALEEQLKVINKLREAQGLKPVEHATDPLQNFIAQREAMKKNEEMAKELTDGLKEIDKAIMHMPADAFEGQTYTIQQMDSALSKLSEGIKNGDADFFDFAETMAKLRDENKNLPPDIKELVDKVIDLASKSALSSQALDDLRTAMDGSAKAAANAAKITDSYNKALQDMGNIAKAQIDDVDSLADAYHRALLSAKSIGEIHAAEADFITGGQRIEDERVRGSTKAGLEYLKGKAATPHVAASLDRLEDSMITALVELFQKLPESARITQGVRTYAEQAEIRARHERMPGGVRKHPAARAGHSRHEEGTVAAGGAAVDISGLNMQTLRDTVKLIPALEQLDVVSEELYQNDKVHVQLAGTKRKQDKADADQQIKNAEKADRAAKKAADDEQKASERRAKNYADMIRDSENATKNLTAEQQAIANGAHIREDENYVLIKGRIEREMLAKAQQENVNLSDQEREKISAAADAQARAQIALSKTRKVEEDYQKDLQQQKKDREQMVQEMNQIASSAVSGLVNDLMNGVSAGEAFNNMLKNIIASLAQMAVKSLFSEAGIGGILSSFIGGGMGGGTVGMTGHRERRNPALWAGAPKFARGGIVGLRPGEVPIIAHKGEIIIPTSKAMGAASGRGGGGISEVHTSLGDVNIDMAGTGMVAANNDDAREFGKTVQKLIQLEMVRESRPGGLLRKVPG